MATPLPARWDGIGPVPPSMVAVLQSSGPRASVIDFKMEPAAKICPRTSSALEIDDWTRKLRDICGTFGLTAVMDNEMGCAGSDGQRLRGGGAGGDKSGSAEMAAAQRRVLPRADGINRFIRRVATNRLPHDRQGVCRGRVVARRPRPVPMGNKLARRGIQAGDGQALQALRQLQGTHRRRCGARRRSSRWTRTSQCRRIAL